MCYLIHFFIHYIISIWKFTPNYFVYISFGFIDRATRYGKWNVQQFIYLFVWKPLYLRVCTLMLWWKNCWRFRPTNETSNWLLPTLSKIQGIEQNSLRLKSISVSLKTSWNEIRVSRGKHLDQKLEYSTQILPSLTDLLFFLEALCDFD